MASRKKKVAPVEETEIKTEEITPVEEEVKTEEIGEPETKEIVKPAKKIEEKKKPRYSVGSIVYVSKEADADLNGFKLFPQYKKYTYTVEAYDEISGVYTLRRLNLSLRLPERLILAPDERAHDVLNRKQF